MKGFTIALVAHLIVNVFSETPVKNATVKYDPAELLRKIFNTNDTILPRANYGLIKFEGQIPQQDLVNFQAQNNLENNRENIYNHETSVKFENDNIHSNDNIQNVNFADKDNKGSKMKKRRKRKPKQHNGLQSPGNVPYSGYGYASSLPYSGYYGNQQNLPHLGYGNGPAYPLNGGNYHRPARQRPRPSIAAEALSAVTAALTSIAMYDDYQCVPRLLCEAAAGGALGSGGILQTVSGLQPLLTLLSAYSGLTSSPLFVFGRAALLGASDGNQATCRYAYPHCPTDPERLVHYLNNHNGGFFRFFNAPQQGQQNVDQFYNQLSHNFGPYYPNQEYNQNLNQQNYNNQQNNENQDPGLYSNYNQNYGLAYPYQNYNQNIRFKNNDDFKENTNEIQKRIQNKPHTLYIDDLEEGNSKWTFPEGNRNIKVNYVNNDDFNSFSPGNNFRDNDEELNNYDRNRYHKDKRKGKMLKFPGAHYEEDLQVFENNRGFFFPEQANKQYEDGPLNNNNYYKYYDERQYLNYNNPSKDYDSKYQDESKYFDYNTATNPNHNNYDNNYNDKRQYSEFNFPSNNNDYNTKYHYKRQYFDYNAATNYNNYDDKYSDHNTHSNKNYESQYSNSDENYYANRYYANKYNDNYANNNKYNNYNNDLQEGVRTVYVVRGNGDPNNPEVHKLRPGESLL